MVKHLIAPVIGTAVLLYPLYEMAKPGQPFPYNFVAYIVLAWIIIGYGLYAYLKRSRRRSWRLWAPRWLPTRSTSPSSTRPASRPGSELPEPDVP